MKARYMSSFVALYIAWFVNILNPYPYTYTNACTACIGLENQRVEGISSDVASSISGGGGRGRAYISCAEQLISFAKSDKHLCHIGVRVVVSSDFHLCIAYVFHCKR